MDGRTSQQRLIVELFSTMLRITMFCPHGLSVIRELVNVRFCRVMSRDTGNSVREAIRTSEPLTEPEMAAMFTL